MLKINNINTKKLNLFLLEYIFRNKNIITFFKNYNIFIKLNTLSKKELLWFILIELKKINYINNLFFLININNSININNISINLEYNLYYFIWGYFNGIILLNN